MDHRLCDMGKANNNILDIMLLILPILGIEEMRMEIISEIYRFDHLSKGLEHDYPSGRYSASIGIRFSANSLRYSVVISTSPFWAGAIKRTNEPSVLFLKMASQTR